MLRVYVAFALFMRISAEFDPEKHRNWKILPHDICGRTGSYRIIGGHETSLNAFPWIVRVGISTLYRVHFTCAGVLLNSDTVLTTAHCLPTTPFKKLGPIRLGEHNLATNPDCNSDICADPVLEVAPLRVLAPKGYSTSLFEKDIAIIKLKKNVTFSESVSPICLGNKRFFARDFAGSIVEAAGWGYYSVEEQSMSKILRVIQIPVLKQELCKEKYRFRLSITESQMCAGGEPGVDACNGDSGGPLMIVDDKTDGPRYYLLGLTSFGPLHCGNPNYPGLYTNLTTFIEWVLDNLDGSGRVPSYQTIKYYQ